VTVGKKLLSGIVALLVATAGVTWSAWYSLASLTRELESATGAIAGKLALAGELKAGANGMRTGQRGMLLTTMQHDRKAMDSVRREYAKRHQDTAEMIAKIRPLMDESGRDESGRKLIDSLAANVDRHANSFQSISDLCGSGKVSQAARIYREQGAAIGAAMENTAAQLMALERQAMLDAAASGKRQANVARWTMVAIAAFGVLVFAVIVLAVRAVTEQLRKAAREVGEGATQIADASRQVSGANHSLAQVATQQAATLTASAFSAEHISSMTRKNAENARSAAELMTVVDQRVGDGVRTLDLMAVSVREITSSSGKISNIIKVIDEISFQTNILALNAEVEAARAGEAGMGFAVVAGEVRHLALRSAQAARDTGALIEHSIAKSNEGGARLGQVSEVIRQIVQSASQVKTLVDEVSLGSQQQAREIEAISRGIIEMEKATRMSAASAEEGASASEELAGQASALRGTAVQLGIMTGVQELTGNKTNFPPSYA
jgi:methyl-accepting chemotaxis protein